MRELDVAFENQQRFVVPVYKQMNRVLRENRVREVRNPCPVLRNGSVELRLNGVFQGRADVVRFVDVLPASGALGPGGWAVRVSVK